MGLLEVDECQFQLGISLLEGAQLVGQWQRFGSGSHLPGALSVRFAKLWDRSTPWFQEKRPRR